MLNSYFVTQSPKLKYILIYFDLLLPLWFAWCNWIFVFYALSISIAVNKSVLNANVTTVIKVLFFNLFI